MKNKTTEQIQLDPSRLVGFSATSQQSNSKVKTEIGNKIGEKGRVKVGVKVGGKVGGKTIE